MTKNSHCPQCGQKLIETAIFCPGCGNKVKSNNTIKKERVLNNKTNSKKSWIYIGLTSIALLCALIFFRNSDDSKELSVINKQPVVTNKVVYSAERLDHTITMAFVKDNTIILPLNLVIEKKFVRFQIAGSNTNDLPIVAYLTEDGKVVTAVSMCEPCNSTEFHIKGSNLICNSCGTTWNLNDLKAISGSCGKYPPDPLPSVVVGNEIQIDKSLVENWKRRV
jgi:uncharacterized Zn finger protein (UPF0148 family)